MTVHFYRSPIEIAVVVSILAIVKVLTKTALSSNLVFGCCFCWVKYRRSSVAPAIDIFAISLMGIAVSILQQSNYGFDRLFGQSRV
jgi:hypothetical protein